MTSLFLWKIAFILEIVMLLLGGFYIYLGDQKRRKKKAWQDNIILGIILVAGATLAIITTINKFL